MSSPVIQRTTILFLCTGNYYRSRFAEIYFNHHAQASGLLMHAESRGLATELNGHLVGSISPWTVSRLKELAIPQPEPHRHMQACTTLDLQGAQRIIALKEAEHRPLLASKFPGWEGRVTYWHVHDLDAATPDVALGEIQRLVDHLLYELRTPSISA